MRTNQEMTEDQIMQIRAMLEGGFSQRGCALRLGISTTLVRRLVHDLNLNSKTKQSQQAYRQRKMRGTDFHLRDLPLSDQYVLNTGTTDRYLERLRKVHGEHAHKANRNNP